MRPRFHTFARWSWPAWAAGALWLACRTSGTISDEGVDAKPMPAGAASEGTRTAVPDQTPPQEGRRTLPHPGDDVRGDVASEDRGPERQLPPTPLPPGGPPRPVTPEPPVEESAPATPPLPELLPLEPVPDVPPISPDERDDGA